jgi:hypothetical protein
MVVEENIVEIVESRLVTLDELIKDGRAVTFVEAADLVMEAMGYTEHGLRHARRTAKVARNILHDLGFDDRLPELAAIAGYFHDAGNVINRSDHAHSSALMALHLLADLRMPSKDIAAIMSAIGHHDESDGAPVSAVSASVILADKADVHRTRVRLTDQAKFDIHDRVNYSVTRSGVLVDRGKKLITLELDVDTTMSSVMEFFEIFTERLIMCRLAAEYLGCQFRLVANSVDLYGASKV